MRDLSKYPSDADEAGLDERRLGIGLPSITLRCCARGSDGVWRCRGVLFSMVLLV